MTTFIEIEQNEPIVISASWKARRGCWSPPKYV
jgi:hypothetical protein